MPNFYILQDAQVCVKWPNVRCWCVTVSCHSVRATTCTYCDRLIRTGFLANDMELSGYFRSAMSRYVYFTLWLSVLWEGVAVQGRGHRS